MTKAGSSNARPWNSRLDKERGSGCSYSITRGYYKPERVGEPAEAIQDGTK